MNIILFFSILLCFIQLFSCDYEYICHQKVTKSCEVMVTLWYKRHRYKYQCTL